MPYFIAPFIAWLLSGIIKFAINYIKYGNKAKQRIGNGGFPSTHTTVMTTPTMLIGLNEGFMDPTFGLGVAVTFIVIIDATGLRINVGKHASLLNRLTNQLINAPDLPPTVILRESMGHNKIEILGGLCLGTLLALAFYYLMK